MARSPQLRDAEERVQAKSRELKTFIDDNTNAAGEYTFDDAGVDTMRQKNAELSDLITKRDQYAEIELVSKGLQRDESPRDDPHLKRVMRAPGADDDDGDNGAHAIKSLGDLWAESKAWEQKEREIETAGYRPEHQLKATMTTGAGFAPETTRTGRVVDFATRPPRVIDLYPTVTTEQTAVVFMEETTFDNTAAERAEATGVAPEAALVYTERQSPVRKIPVNLPVTEEQLADVDGMRGRIDNRLDLMLRQRLDIQLVAGDGVPPNLDGLMNTAGIQTQAKGADPAFDAFFKASTLVMHTGFADVTAIGMHPTNWQVIRLTRTTDGIYILGNPADPAPARLFGIPVITSTAFTLGTGLTGDWLGYAEVAFKQGVEFQVTDSHAAEFLNGILRIKATLRAAHVVYRPAAFCTVTGLLAA